MERELASQREIADQISIKRQIEQDTLSIQKAKLESQEKSLRTAQNELRTAKDLADAERGRLDSIEARLGRLGDSEASEVRNIADRAKKAGGLGGLSREDQERIRTLLGGVSEIDAALFAADEKRGERIGALSIVESLGGKSLTGEGSRLAGLEKDVAGRTTDLSFPPRS